MTKETGLLKPICLGLVIFSISWLVWMPNKGEPCTLWAIAGDSVVGEGTILVKNRDWTPNHQQKMELITPPEGYRYLGLIAMGKDMPGLKGGVNEEGLVVVTASAPSYLEQQNNLYPVKGVIQKILKNCRNVREAIKQEDWFIGPRFIMMADAKEIACVEVGLNGKFKIQSTTSGNLSHTNHYLESDFIALNPEKPYVSSQERQRQIQQFLSTKQNFDLHDFIKVSRSEEGGPDNSIWRRGSTARSSRTLATWIVHQPVSRNTILFLRMANPGKEIKEYHYTIKDLFSGKVDLKKVE